MCVLVALLNARVPTCLPRPVRIPTAPGPDLLHAHPTPPPEEMGVSSVHVTFPTGQEWAALGAAGFQQRRGIQYHFENRCAARRGVLGACSGDRRLRAGTPTASVRAPVKASPPPPPRAPSAQGLRNV
jgi:hypothetical protein